MFFQQFCSWVHSFVVLHCDVSTCFLSRSTPTTKGPCCNCIIPPEANTTQKVYEYCWCLILLVLCSTTCIMTCIYIYISIYIYIIIYIITITITIITIIFTIIIITIITITTIKPLPFIMFTTFTNHHQKWTTTTTLSMNIRLDKKQPTGNMSDLYNLDGHRPFVYQVGNSKSSWRRLAEECNFSCHEDGSGTGSGTLPLRGDRSSFWELPPVFFCVLYVCFSVIFYVFFGGGRKNIGKMRTDSGVWTCWIELSWGWKIMEIWSNSDRY